jgi:DNA-binding LytR/AlgR family response regulator
VFPITFGVLTKYHKALKEYSRIGDLSLLPDSENFIEFTAENERDKLRVSLNELLYIESADNYSRFVYVSNPPELMRASLSRLETQLTTELLVRCHRSYLVNLTKVKKVRGNAQGYRLGLEGSEFEVPVARRFSHLVNKLKTGLN